MKTITYKTLMKKIEDGRMDIDAWDAEVWEGCGSTKSFLALAVFYGPSIDSRPRRETIIVSKCPEDM